MIEESLIAFLLSKSGVTTLVSDRVYNDRAPQATTTTRSTFPRILTTTNSSDVQYDQSGESGLVDRSVQIQCQGLSKSSAKAVAAAVKAELSGYTGAIDDDYTPCCMLRSETDSFVTPDDGSDVGIYLVDLDFRLWHAE